MNKQGFSITKERAKLINSYINNGWNKDNWEIKKDNFPTLRVDASNLELNKQIPRSETKKQETFEDTGWDFDNFWKFQDEFPRFIYEEDAKEESPFLPMYEAFVNSPITKIVEYISHEQEFIIVEDINKLPPAPNLATIGNDEDAETILYTSINGNELTVQRGIEGVAKSWSAGTVIARNFTAYDHKAFKDNIEVLIREIEKIKQSL